MAICAKDIKVMNQEELFFTKTVTNSVLYQTYGQFYMFSKTMEGLRFFTEDDYLELKANSSILDSDTDKTRNSLNRMIEMKQVKKEDKTYFIILPFDKDFFIDEKIKNIFIDYDKNNRNQNMTTHKLFLLYTSILYSIKYEIDLKALIKQNTFLNDSIKDSLEMYGYLEKLRSCDLLTYYLKDKDFIISVSGRETKIHYSKTPEEIIQKKKEDAEKKEKKKKEKKLPKAYVYSIYIDGELAYIGKTYRDIKQRVSEHMECCLDEKIPNSQQQHLYKAMRECKIGYQFKILYFSSNKVNNHELEELEKKYIEDNLPKYNYEGIVVPYRFSDEK